MLTNKAGNFLLHECKSFAMKPSFTVIPDQQTFAGIVEILKTKDYGSPAEATLVRKIYNVYGVK